MIEYSINFLFCQAAPISAVTPTMTSEQLSMNWVEFPACPERGDDQAGRAEPHVPLSIDQCRCDRVFFSHSDVRRWHNSEVTARLAYARFWGKPEKHLSLTAHPKRPFGSIHSTCLGLSYRPRDGSVVSSHPLHE
jgi:hypothetical protein